MTEYEERSLSLLRAILIELEKLNAKNPRAKKERIELVGAGLPQLAKIWNQWKHESLRAVISMDSQGTRAKACAERWKKRPDEPYWVRVIQRLNKSDFLLGKNERKWLADFEFLCRIDQDARILEGKFDNKSEDNKPEKRYRGQWLNPETGNMEDFYG